MYIYAALFILLVYAIYQERIDVRERRFVNDNSKPNSDDSPYKLIQKYKESISYFYMNRIRWRIPYISTIFIVFLFWYIVFKKIPSEWNLITLGAPILLYLYAVWTYYNHHLTKTFTDHLVNISNTLEDKLESKKCSCV